MNIFILYELFRNFERFFHVPITVKVPNFAGIYSRGLLHGQASQGLKKRRRDGGLKEWKGYFAMVGLKEFSHIHGWVGSIA